MRRFVVLLSLWSLGACTADYADGTLICARDGECPSGWQCRPRPNDQALRCYRNRVDASLSDAHHDAQADASSCATRCGVANYCDGEPRCDEDGNCLAPTPRDCDDNIECTTDSCDRDNGGCRHDPPDNDHDGHPDITCVDSDGNPLGDDCDDNDNNRYPGNLEVCDATHDEDCNPLTIGTTDADGDGEVSETCCNGDQCGTDCNDDERAQRSGQVEFCDGIDNDCDDVPDNETRDVPWYPDTDGDGFGDPDGQVVSDCNIVLNHSVLGTDCDDDNAGISPVGVEACDDIDNDCDDRIDENLEDCMTTGGTGGMGGSGDSGVDAGMSGTGGVSGTGGASGDGGSMSDPCDTNNGGCSTNPLVMCTNDDGQATCGPCPAAYFGDGITCTPCGTDVPNCASGLTCTSDDDSTCAQCAPGYVGDGTGTCTPCAAGTYDDNDACIDCGTIARCATSETCNANDGSNLVCPTCDVGYNGSGTSICTMCTAIAHCASDLTCTNSTDQRCGTCAEGYTGNGTGTCRDINECLTNNGGCSTSPMVSCTNTDGSRTCGLCGPGYFGNGITCTACTAIANCASGLTCTSGGNSTCAQCAAGFIGDGTGSCTPCGAGTYDNNNACTTCPQIANCATTETCNVTNGNNSTCPTCASGYRGNGTGTCTACTAIANCASGLTCTSASNQTCGTCAPGYVGDGTGSCTPCGSGTYDSNNACVDCGTIANCASVETCNVTNGSNDVCPTCASGYYGSGTGSCISVCAGSDCTPDYPCQQYGTTSESTCRGQYADWAPATSPNTFTVNSDGTVTDSRSGLVWQRAATAALYTHAEAGTHCTGLALAGGDWRLPTKAELESILDFGRFDPAIDPTAFPLTPGAIFWTSSPYVGSAGSGWTVYFNSGGSRDTATFTTNRARCVRSLVPAFVSNGSGATPLGRYALGSGTVRDNRTGLLWQQTVSGTSYTQAAGASYCMGLSLGGFSTGWRLPTVAELRTLVDPTRASPSIDPSAFPSTPSADFWTSTPYLGSVGEGWRVRFSDGSSSNHATSDAYRVRCVR